ncbi:MAG: hypothetical protein GY950_04020 [bacterium]|nr:hypothetical protein [bacterium]
MNINLEKKMVLTVFVILLSISFLSAEKVMVLKDVIKPDVIQTKDGKLYVLEKTSIFIYSLNDFRLIKKFGRAGEGPMEFMARPYGPPLALSFQSDKLVVNSNTKLSYFTLEGKYISEEKAPPDAIYFRTKNGYLGIGATMGDDNQTRICYRLFGPDFKNPRILYQTEIALNQRPDFLVPMNALNYYPLYNDKIFIAAGKKDFAIDCFDLNGKKLFTIRKKDYKKIAMTDAYKKSTLDWFKRNPTFRPIYEREKHRIKFKDYFPAIKSIAIDNGRLYVLTNKTEKGLWECIVTDFKGKVLKRVLVPLHEPEPYSYYPMLFSIEKGKYYSLIENEDEETWELHRVTL